MRPEASFVGTNLLQCDGVGGDRCLEPSKDSGPNCRHRGILIGQGDIRSCLCATCWASLQPAPTAIAPDNWDYRRLSKFDRNTAEGNLDSERVASYNWLRVVDCSDSAPAVKELTDPKTIRAATPSGTGF